MSPLPSVQLRSSYRDPDRTHEETFLLVELRDGVATIRPEDGGEEITLPASSLRWSEEDPHLQFLTLLRQDKIEEARASLVADPLIDVEGTREKPSIYLTCYLPGATELLKQRLIWLQSFGVDIDQRHLDNPFAGWTALAHAIHDNDLNVARLLIELGADLSAATAPDAYDVMSLAASTGSFKVMGWLLNQGFEPSSTLQHLDVLREDEKLYQPANYAKAIFSSGMALPLFHRAAISEYESEEDALAMFNHLMFNDPSWNNKDGNGNTALEAAWKVNPGNAKLLGSLIAALDGQTLADCTISSGASGPKVRL